MYLKNQWYLAAWADEVSRDPLHRRLLGQPIVFYRTEAGQLVALYDQCPHRIVPLSKGYLVGDSIRCAYHGATFGVDGKCSHMPGLSDLSKADSVQSYPVIEKWAAVWIWMGDPDKADESKLPPAQLLQTQDWRVIKGVLKCEANYQLAIDNLLDLSHEAYLHPNTIGTEEVAESPVKFEVDDEKIAVSRIMENVSAPPLFSKVLNHDSTIDRYQTVSWHLPCFVTVDVRAIATDNSDLQLQWQVLFFMTPEEDERTHYFFAVSRNFALDSSEIDKVLNAHSLQTLDEDIDMLEAQQRCTRRFPLEQRTLFTKYDAAPDKARRILKRKVEQERAEAAG